MAEKKNLFQRLLAAQSSIGMVGKNLSVGYGKSSYRAVGEADVLAAVKQAEMQHGIYSYPLNREIIDQQIIETVDREGREKKQMYVRIKTTYRFLNVDNPEEYIETEAYGDGLDSADKAPGKAATYSDKYCLLKVYKISTGEDPDQYESPEIIAAKKQQAQAAEAAEHSRLVAQAEETMVKHKIMMPDLCKVWDDKPLSEYSDKALRYIISKPDALKLKIAAAS